MPEKREKSLLAKLEEYVPTHKAYFIMWKFCGMYQHLNFEEFSKNYLNGVKPETIEKYMLEEDVQKAIKYAKKIVHQKNLIELYEIYFEKAKEDTQAFRAFNDFSKSFFADEKDSELTVLLNGIDDVDDE